MMKELSLKTLKRSPLKTVLLSALLLLVTAFFCLGVNMLYNSNSLLKQADKAYTTIGILEYTGGSYPDETSFSKETVDKIQEFDLKSVVNQEEVKEFRSMNTMLASLGEVTLGEKFCTPFYQNVVTIFKVQYFNKDGEYGSYRCLEVERGYSVLGKNTTFNLSSWELPQGEKLKVGNTYIANGILDEWNWFMPDEKCEVFEPEELKKQFPDYPLVDITGKEDYLKSEEGKTWKQICEFYQIENSSVTAYAMDYPETTGNFYLGSQELQEGRFWTREEAEEKKKVCLIDESIAGFLNVKVGDTIDLNFHYGKDPVHFLNSYHPEEGFKDQGSYKVLGIYSTLRARDTHAVYVPEKSVKTIPKNKANYSMGTLILENGASEKYLEEVNHLLVNDFRINVYDQGYGQAAAPILAMRTNAVLIIILCGISTIAVLILFANLFIWKQQESVAIMNALGTGRKKILQFLCVGGGIITFAGVFLGGIIGVLVSKGAINFAYHILKENYQRDLRYSSIAMGVQKAFEGQITTSVPLVLLVMGGIFALSLLLCYIMGGSVIKKTAGISNPYKSKKKKKETTLVQAVSIPKENFLFRGEELKRSYRNSRKLLFLKKQSLRSVRRNKSSSILLVCVTLALSVFIICYTAGIEHFEKTLEKTYQESRVKAYFTTIYGEQISGGKVPGEVLEVMEESPHVVASCMDYSCKYEYVGKNEEKEGSKKSEKRWDELINEAYGVSGVQSTSPYWMETRIKQIFNDDNLILTGSMSNTSEFFGMAPPIVNYMEGYEDFFSRKEKYGKKDVIPALVTIEFLTENNLKIGDRIEIAQLMENSADGSSDYLMVPRRVKIAGTYQKASGRNNIYLANREEGLPFERKWSNGVKEWIERIPVSKGFANYLLGDVQHLEDLRDAMERVRVTNVGVIGGARVALVIDDKELIQTVDNLNNNISFMKTLRYVLFVLVFLIGFVVSFMTIRTRKPEFAIMRSMGTGTLGTFTVFFSEQLFLGFMGTVLGILGTGMNLGGLTVLELLSVLLFFLIFVLGTGISIGRMNQKNVLGILSDKE